MKSIINQESFQEALEVAVRRVTNTQGREITTWILEHRDDLSNELESILLEVVRRVAKPRPGPTKPVLDFGRLRLWAYDADQGCNVSEHRSMQFGHDNRAGLVYEEQSIHGHYATDKPLDNESTWEWIAEWMRKGFASEGLLDEEGKLK